MPHNELQPLKRILNRKQLTKTQQCMARGTGAKLTLSLKQVKELKRGGFIFTIPTILAAIGALGSLAGGGAAIAKSVLDAKKNRAELEEQKRHNAIIETALLKSKTGGRVKRKRAAKKKNCWPE